MLRPKYILKPQHLPYWRRHPDLNWGIKVLQTSALPLGYVAIFITAFPHAEKLYLSWLG